MRRGCRYWGEGGLGGNHSSWLKSGKIKSGKIAQMLPNRIFNFDRACCFIVGVFTAVKQKGTNYT